MKKEPEFVSQSTIDRMSLMPKEENRKLVERVFLNDQITTVKADSSNHAANQMKIRSDIAMIKAMSVGVKY